MANAPGELNNLSTMFEWRFHEIWRMHGQGKLDEAETAAGELLMEPRLSSLHRAGLHLILAGSPHDYVNHAREAVRLYTEVKQQYQHTFSADQEANIQKMLDGAKTILHAARTDQEAANLEVQKELATGKTMSELHDAKIKQSFELLKDGNEGGGLSGPVSASRPGLPSRQTGPTTVSGDSQRTETGGGRSQSTALTDFDDDTSPLPPMGEFRYSDDDDKA